MTFEQALISALSVVVTALGYLYRQLNSRSEKCEQWRDRQEPVIQDLREKVGALSAVAAFAQGCTVSGCPLAGRAETFSITANHKTS